jgi:hypothetical protein
MEIGEWLRHFTARTDLYGITLRVIDFIHRRPIYVFGRDRDDASAQDTKREFEVRCGSIGGC